MQQLHLVGFTTDHKQLILSARRGTKSGGFSIAIDDRLLALVDEALRRRQGGDGDDRLEQHRRFARQDSQLSPREIQSRLRSGSTLAQVASDAGVDEDWIARFAAPILAEQAQVVGRARDMRYATPRKGESAQPLGTAVRWNVADRGLRLGDDEFDASWGAFQLRDGNWVVRFAFVSRQRQQEAEWEIDFHEGTVTSRDRLASNLGYIAPKTRPPAAELLASATPPPPPSSPSSPEGEPEEPPSLPGRPTKRAPKKKAAARRKKAAATKRAAPRPAPKKVGKKKAAARKVAAKRGIRRPVKRAPVKKTKSAAKKRAKKATKKTAKKAAKKRRPAARPRPAPVAPERLALPPARAPAEVPRQPESPPEHEPRSVRRAREREVEPAPPIDDVDARPAEGPVATSAASAARDRVVTIRADRATPPTQSQLGSSNRRRRATLRQ